MLWFSNLEPVKRVHPPREVQEHLLPKHIIFEGIKMHLFYTKILIFPSLHFDFHLLRGGRPALQWKTSIQQSEKEEAWLSRLLPFQRFDYFTIFAPLQKAQTAVKINRSFAFKYEGCIKSNLKARAKLQPIEAETWPIHFSRAFKTWVHPIKLYLAFLTGCQSRIKLDQISAKWLDWSGSLTN